MLVYGMLTLQAAALSDAPQLYPLPPPLFSDVMIWLELEYAVIPVTEVVTDIYRVE